MQKRFLMLAAAATMFAIPAAAQSSIDGTWKIDINSAKLSQKPMVLSLENGMYKCDSCTPAVSIPADGKFHALPKDPELDALAVTRVDANTVRLQMKNDGKIIRTIDYTRGADGTIDYDSRWTNPATDKQGRAQAQLVRVGAAAPGTNWFSGSWRPGTVRSVTDNGLMITYRTSGDMLSMQSPSGSHYDAKIDGPFVAVKDTTPGTEVAVSRSGPNLITERWKRNGKIYSVNLIETAADGKTQRLTSIDMDDGTVFRANSTKQ